MRTRDLVLLFSVTAALLCGATCNNATGPKACCFYFREKEIHSKYIRSYTLTDPRCSQTAVILMTHFSKRYCVHKEKTWVQRVMGILDERTL